MAPVTAWGVELPWQPEPELPIEAMRELSDQFRELGRAAERARLAFDPVAYAMYYTPPPGPRIPPLSASAWLVIRVLLALSIAALIVEALA